MPDNRFTRWLSENCFFNSCRQVCKDEGRDTSIFLLVWINLVLNTHKNPFGFKKICFAHDQSWEDLMTPQYGNRLFFHVYFCINLSGNTIIPCQILTELRRRWEISATRLSSITEPCCCQLLTSFNSISSKKQFFQCQIFTFSRRFSKAEQTLGCKGCVRKGGTNQRQVISTAVQCCNHHLLINNPDWEKET